MMKHETVAGPAARQEIEKHEMVFAAVDKLKQDLNKATQITKEGKVLSMISAGYAITWAIVNKKLVRHVWANAKSLLLTDAGRAKAEQLKKKIFGE